MRTLGWLNVVHAVLLTGAFAFLLVQSGEGAFEPARFSEPAVFGHWSDVFLQLANAVVPLAGLALAQLLAFGATRSRDVQRRRRARAACLVVLAFFALYLLQASALGAFDELTVSQTLGCIAGLAAVVAVCAIDVVKLGVPAARGVAPTPGFEPGTR